MFLIGFDPLIYLLLRLRIPSKFQLFGVGHLCPKPVQKFWRFYYSFKRTKTLKKWRLAFQCSPKDIRWTYRMPILSIYKNILNYTLVIINLNKHIIILRNNILYDLCEWHKYIQEFTFGINYYTLIAIINKQ